MTEREELQLYNDIDRLEKSLSVIFERLNQLDVCNIRNTQNIDFTKEKIETINNNISKLFDVVEKKSKSSLSFFLDISKNIIGTLIIGALFIFFRR